MYAQKGLAHRSPQVGLPYRFCVLILNRRPETRDKEASNHPIAVIMNARATIEDDEGC